MCGLAGVMIGPDRGDQEVARFLLKELLERIETRGHHATGVGVYAEGDKPGRIWKVAETASKVLKSKVFNDFVDGLPDTSRIFIGHTRYGTHGSNTKNENAHPFQKGRVIGAHNGVLYNYRQLARDYQMVVPEVDSEIAFSLLDRFKDPTKILPDLEGSFALTWIKSGKLWTTKSDGAQLCFAYVPEFHMLVWASEMRQLCGAIEWVGIKQNEYQTFQPAMDTVYRFDHRQFDDKGTNRLAIKCELQKRRSFFASNKSDTTVRPFRESRTWNWEEYYQTGETGTVSQQTTMFQDAKTVDRRSSTGKKGKSGGAVTGKEPSDVTAIVPQRNSVTWDELCKMVEVLVRDRVRLKHVVKDYEKRISELERQMDMVHDTVGCGIDPLTSCLYCANEIDDIKEAVRLPQGDVHYSCLFAQSESSPK